MRPPGPLVAPLKVSLVEDEIVFIGQGPAFSMTPKAARLTLFQLAQVLHDMAATEASSAIGVVLLVEDEPLVRELGALILGEAGYSVIEAASAPEALQTLEAGARVHLLFTDINMPGELDGLQLARVVADRWPAVRLLVSSGQSQPGVDDLPRDGRFIPKPYIAEDMLRHVDELLEA